MAMVCGNTYVLKPSERDPGATMLLAQLAQDAGIPDGSLNIIHGAHDGMSSLPTFVFKRRAFYPCFRSSIAKLSLTQ